MEWCKMTQTVALSQNKRRALEAMLSHPSITSAADACKLNRSTLHRYLKDPVFVAELRRRQQIILTSVTSALVGLACEPIDTMRDLLADPDVPASVKARVALGWLAILDKRVDQDVLLERLTQLEAALHAQSIY
jgi:hypothetical protein